MMKKHYTLKGEPDEVTMPFELSGMMVDRKPAQRTNNAQGFSGMGFEPPEVKPRPAPAEFTFKQPSAYPPQQPVTANLGSINAPKTARRPLAGAVAYAGGFAALAAITYYAMRFLNEEDDE